MSETGGPRRETDMTPPPFPEFSLSLPLFLCHFMRYVTHNGGSGQRKIVQSICGHNKDTDHWSCRFNKELCDLFKGHRLSVAIRIVRLLWAGHVARMEEICMPKRLKLEG